MSDHKEKTIGELVVGDNVAILNSRGDRMLGVDVVERVTATQVILAGGHRYKRLGGFRVSSRFGGGGGLIRHISETERAQFVADQEIIRKQREERDRKNDERCADPRHILLRKISSLSDNMTDGDTYLQCSETALQVIFDLLLGQQGLQRVSRSGEFVSLPD